MRLQDFLLRPEVPCAFGLGFPPGAPLPGGAGLGTLIFTAVNYINLQGLVAQIYIKKTLSVKFVLSWFPRDKMAIKRGIFPGLTPEREVARPVFECGGQGCCVISE